MPRAVSFEPVVHRVLPRAAAGSLLRVGLLGFGRVGRAVASLAAASIDARLRVVCPAALVRQPTRLPAVPPMAFVTDPDDVLARADVVVEVLGGLEPARSIVTRALAAGIPVVTANKTLVAHHGPELRRLAVSHRTAFRYEASVLAGVPFLGALARRPHLARVTRIAGVLNGTSHFVLCAVGAGASPSDALAEAARHGYAESDATADLSGRDAAEKLAILIQVCFSNAVRVDQLSPVSIANVAAIDCAGARLFDGAIKPVALAALAPGGVTAWIGPAFVATGDAIGRLEGVENLVRLTHTSGRVVTFAGPGAGPDATAATILDDVAEIAAGVESDVATEVPAAGIPMTVSKPAARWFVRVDAGGRITARVVAETIAACDLPAERLVVHAGSVFAMTRVAPAVAAARAEDALRQRGARPLVVPVVEA